MNPSSQLSPLASWTLGEVAAIVQGDVDPRFAGRPFAPVSTDSRSVAPGEFFLALRGEKFDGHRFCEVAAGRGAAGLIVDRHYEVPAALAGLPILVVGDTLRAYGDLAAARRRAWGGPALAISGSAGKTTTRRLLADALRRHRRVLEPVKNYNNLIGLPYTLLRLEAAHEIAVLELGMNLPGELKRLAEIAAPTAALLTQINLTHVGMFASMAELVSAKLDLFRATPAGAPLVVNAACPNTMAALAQFEAGHPIVRFLGERMPVDGRPADVFVSNISTVAPLGYRFDLNLPGARRTGLVLKMFGRHHLDNVAAAAALLHAAGLPPEWVAEALDDFRTEPLRGERIATRQYTLILDCYNASPPSMLSALASLAELAPPPGRRVLVLADMLELGEHAAAAHAGMLGPLRRLAPALFFGLGPHCAALADTLEREGWAARGFDKRDALIDALKEDLRPGDQVFFKGSHGFGLERVAQAIAPDANILDDKSP